MPFKHGVYVSEAATSLSTPIKAETGVPYYFGTSCITAAESPAQANVPVLCTSFDEFAQKLGYSDEWGKYNLCEAAYSHFRVFGCQPAIFCNVLDPDGTLTDEEPESMSFVSHRLTVPSEAVPSTVVLSASSGGTEWVKDTDYAVAWDGDASAWAVTLLPGGGHYSAATAYVGYSKLVVTPTDAQLAEALEAVETCITLGVIPDLIASPGFSGRSAVAAAMAGKARAVSGIFRAKAVIDIPTDSAHGADTYDDAAELKSALGFTDENEILCWGLLGLGGRIAGGVYTGGHVFHQSSQLCGLMAAVDAENGAPYVSPSNKSYRMDCLVAEKTEGVFSPVLLTKAQADYLNSQGIVTALNFLSRGWVCWGDWTAAYPGSADVKDVMIPVSRMFDWVANTCIRTFWAQIDRPMTRRFVDSIVDTCNIWLNGIVGSGMLLGARVEFKPEENPATDLMAGVIKLHVYITPPCPAVEIDFVLEYDPEYLNNLFGEEA